MDGNTLEELTRVMQASISPVALVSGVGLLILSQTNRLGRVMDRLRNLVDERRRLNAADAHVDREIVVLLRRARILRGTVTAAALSALLASFLVLLMFISAVLDVRIDRVIIAMFAASIFSLILSLLLFIHDMHLALRAVQEEMQR